jgi:RHS repeat-associated protein
MQLHNVILLVTDQQRSVLNVLDEHHPHPIAYTSYGHRLRENGLLTLLGFNGELSDPLTGHYLLGNGYRAFNPVLMRFNSPDSWSPLGKAGLNAYAYCVGDPVNRSDPTGHVGNPFKGLLNLLGRRSPRMVRANQAFDAAIQTPASGPPPQALGAPAAPPPYSVQPTAHPYNGMSLQDLNALPPAYYPGVDVPSLGRQSVSTPNLEPPPPYFETVNQTGRQGRKQHLIDELTSHRDRILHTTRDIPHEQLGTSIRDTLEHLNTNIAVLRRQL